MHHSIHVAIQTPGKTARLAQWLCLHNILISCLCCAPRVELFLLYSGLCTQGFSPQHYMHQRLLLAVLMQEKGLVKLVMCNVVCLEEWNFPGKNAVSVLRTTSTDHRVTEGLTGQSWRHFSGSESCPTAVHVQKECATPQYVHPMSKYIVACN